MTCDPPITKTSMAIWVGVAAFPILFILPAPPCAAQFGEVYGRYDLEAAKARPSPSLSNPPRGRHFVALPQGANVLVNGSFEDELMGWTVQDIVCPNPNCFGSWFSQFGNFSPQTQFAVAAPTDGVFAAMTDQAGFGQHVLFQDFTVPKEGATLSCDVYVNNRHSTYIVPNPNTLDPTMVPNQHFRVDIMDPDAAFDDVGAGVLRNLFITLPGDPLEIVALPGDPAESAYTTILANLDEFAGQKVRLRFAEVDNQNFFHVGVDNCVVALGETRLSSNGVEPSVATDPDGNSLVVWEETDPSGDNTRIFGQRLDVSGEPQGSAFEVTSTGGVAGSPSVALDSDGNGVVVWTHADSNGANLGRTPPLQALGAAQTTGDTIFGRRFNNDGKMEGQFQVNGESLGGLGDPKVTADDSGDFVVTWGSDSGIRGRRFTSSASAKDSEFQVAGMGSGTPSVGSSSSGAFVVIWEEQPTAALRLDPSGRMTASSTEGGIFGLSFDSSGDSMGEPFPINSTPGGNPTSASVATTPDGDFVVVWQQEMEPGEGSDILGRRFSADGQPKGGEFVVNKTTQGNQVQPKVGANSGGAFAVVWETLATADNGTPPDTDGFRPSAADGKGLVSLGQRQNGGGGIFGRYFGDNGMPMGDDFPVDEEEEDSTPSSPAVNVDDDEEITVVFERRDDEGRTLGIFSKTFDAAELAACVAGPTTLCLTDNRYRVEMDFATAQGQSGAAQAVNLTEDTGYFWFFQSTNVEVVIKVLDACDFANRFWVFAGGLTNVEVVIRVADTESGQVNTYINPLNQAFLPLQDTAAFATCPEPLQGAETGGMGALEDGLAAVAQAALMEVTELAEASLKAAAHPEAAPAVTPVRRGTSQQVDCVSSATTLCLNDDRFMVEVDWRTQSDSDSGQQVELTADTGYFWFFNPDNVEMVIKVLDACDFANRFWVFAGGLTNVEVDITVTDTESGLMNFYQNALNQPFQPIQDTDAFATCP